MQGEFCDTTFVEIINKKLIFQYDPTEPGDYRVEVRWAGELVPGSPFPVMIFDTQQELKRFLAIEP